ncbi:glycosyltransferase [Geodermatophilus sp. URMC 63]
MALSFLPLARTLGIPAHYVESATRLDGPSSTGRLLAAVPGLRTYTQDARWADERWVHRGSVLDRFAGVRPVPARPVRRVVVVLGTNPYGFRRVLERLIAILPPEVEVLWQTGVTDTTGLPIRARAAVPARELHEAMSRADVVIAHAGMGAALAALEVGRAPVLVPRRAQRGEQIDDHQEVLGAALAARGLAIVVDADDLAGEVLTAAAALRAVTRPDPPAFVLAETH